MNRYPAQPSEAAVFSAPNAQPDGAIVVGLGPLGGLTQGELARAYGNGLLEYARQAESAAGPDSALTAVPVQLINILDNASAALEALVEGELGVLSGPQLDRLTE